MVWPWLAYFAALRGAARIGVEVRRKSEDERPGHEAGERNSQRGRADSCAVDPCQASIGGAATKRLGDENVPWFSGCDRDGGDLGMTPTFNQRRNERERQGEKRNEVRRG